MEQQNEVNVNNFFLIFHLRSSKIKYNLKFEIIIKSVRYECTVYLKCVFSGFKKSHLFRPVYKSHVSEKKICLNALLNLGLCT